MSRSLLNLWLLFAALLTPAYSAAITANFASATNVPITAASYTATGNTVELSIGFVPPTGTSLTVVKNTGLAFIAGTFSNLAQGQAVELSYNGKSYRFVANYYGGSGNDLVLQWAFQDLVTWGSNRSGQLGNNNTMDSSVPVRVTQNGVLAGKFVVSLSAGGEHCLALCSDGSVAAWGSDSYGELGNSSVWAYSGVPVQVDQSGVLAGKTVVAVAAGRTHSLALCSDGTMAAWGYNGLGQLGNNSTDDSSVPVLVNKSGVLSGKTIISVAAGGFHSLALCSDGTLAAWGSNGYGQLGNNSTTNKSIPVLVNQTGVLAGKTVVSLAGGSGYSLALCSDGTLATWGDNTYGQLGNGGTSISSIPVLVSQSGVLAGKTVTSIAAGYYHCLALCTDGTAATWGDTPFTRVPVLVNQSGVLAGKTVTSVAGGGGYSLALCSDGTLAAWGYNAYGQLGNNTTTNSITPVLVNQSGVLASKTVVYVAAGNAHSLALASVRNPAELSGLSLSSGNLSPTFNTATTVYTASTTSASITLRPTVPDTTATIKVNGSTVASGANSASIQLTDGANAIVIVVTAQDGLTTNTYSVTVTRSPLPFTYLSSSGIPYTATSCTATGNTLNLSLGFLPTTGTNLTVVKNTGLAFIVGRFNNLAQGQDVYLTYNGKSYRFVANYYGGTGNDLVLQWPYRELVTWGDNGSGQLGNSGTTNSIVPGLVMQSGVLAGKTVVSVASGYLHNVALCSDGTLAAWGDNLSGQLGNNTTVASSVPVLVDQSGVLAGKIVTSIAAGPYYSLALCSDGTLAAWGDNGSGQLGNSSTTSSSVPVLVTQSGVLAGKTVVSVVAGYDYSFVLCSDSTLAAWGGNGSGQLGNSSTTGSSVPVLVTQSGVLAGKTVVSIAAGFVHSLALCSDGTLAAWGWNYYGQLGNNSTANNIEPVSVTQSGVLAGKTVVSVAAGYLHSVALCSDGMLAAWGYGVGVQLDFVGNAYSTAPVQVSQSGVLAGKTVTSVTAGFMHSFALCSDGTLAAWGDNSYGQLGNGATSNGISSIPVLVTQNGVLAGKTVTSMAAGYTQSLALCSDGTLATWGENGFGQLGNGSTSTSGVPVRVTQSGVMAGKTVVSVAAGVFHNLALCSDGTLVAWGDNLQGQLGTSDTISSNVPVLVTQNGVLAGKTVVAVAAGEDHSLALCSDGTLVAWGDNFHGQLGTNHTISSNVPVLVTQNGVLAGKSVVSLAAGSRYSVALCSDGTLVAWGSNQFGQLGNNSTTESRVPVLVNQSGVLAGKTVTSITAGSSHSLALCADGTLAAWGQNREGQLGNSKTTDSSIPVWVTQSAVFAGRTVVSVATGGGQSLALYTGAKLATWGSRIIGQRPVFGGVSTNSPGGVTQSGVLTGKTVTSIAAGGAHKLALCSDGTLVAWGFNFMGQLGNDSQTSSSVPVLVTQSGVLAGSTVVSVATGGSHSLAEAAVENPSALSDLVLNTGPLSPAFHPNTTSFSATVSNGTTSVTLKPTVTDDTATINVNGTPVASGTDSAPVPLSVGMNTITTTVTALDGTLTTYTITLTRAGGTFETWQEAVFTEPADRTNPAISGEMATPANDGITNLMKYSLALPPKVDGSGDLPTSAIQNGFLTLTYRKNKLAADVVFTVEACDSLTESTWLPVTNLVSQADMGDHWSITVRDNQPQTSSPKRFMRLRVEK